MENQGQMFGDHVREVTVYVGAVRDTGSRELFVSLQTGTRRLQKRTSYVDWVSTDKVLNLIGHIVDMVETGKMPVGLALETLAGSLLELEEAPF